MMFVNHVNIPLYPFMKAILPLFSKCSQLHIPCPCYLYLHLFAVIAVVRHRCIWYFYINCIYDRVFSCNGQKI